MAKGIRSKSKRANRTFLRKTLFKPQIEKRQKELHKKLITDLKSRKGNSIALLKKKLSTSSNICSALQQPVGKNEADVENDEKMSQESNKMETDDPEETKSSSSEGNEKKIKVINVKKKGSKPRINPNKELVWFK